MGLIVVVTRACICCTSVFVVVQEKIYSKIVLYTSSLLMIGGAYFMQ